MIDEKVLIERLEEKAFSVQIKQGVKEPSTYDAMMEKFSVLEIKEIVKDLASEHNNGWIPCSERLPEIGQMVLVSVAEEKILRNEIILMEYCEALKHMFEDGSILAWRKLPAPYWKGE